MFHVYWPMTAFVTLIIVVGVIVAMLRYGPRLCRLRHTAFADEEPWRGTAYEQPISYA